MAYCFSLSSFHKSRLGSKFSLTIDILILNKNVHFCRLALLLRLVEIWIRRVFYRSFAAVLIWVFLKYFAKCVLTRLHKGEKFNVPVILPFTLEHSNTSMIFFLRYVNILQSFNALLKIYFTTKESNEVSLEIGTYLLKSKPWYLGGISSYLNTLIVSSI